MATPKQILEVDQEKKTITIGTPGTRPVVKIGVAQPFQIVGGDVFTFVDAFKHRVDMAETDRGILCTLRSKLVGPSAPKPKVFLVPWGAVTYVLYGEPMA